MVAPVMSKMDWTIALAWFGLWLAGVLVMALGVRSLLWVIR